MVKVNLLIIPTIDYLSRVTYVVASLNFHLAISCTEYQINYPACIYTLEKAEGEIKIGQSRDTGNIGYTRHWTKTIQRYWQHWIHKTQDEDNPETLATLDTQDTEQRQTQQKHNTEN